MVVISRAVVHLQFRFLTQPMIVISHELVRLLVFLMLERATCFVVLFKDEWIWEDPVEVFIPEQEYISQHGSPTRNGLGHVRSTLAPR